MLTKDRLEAMKLREGTIRVKEEVHNGGWYNSLGEKLGWGDLADYDFKSIQENLQEGELFVVLRERDSFWNFVTELSAVGGMFCKVDPKEKNPGQEYLIEKAYYIISKDAIYRFVSWGDRPLTEEQVANLIRNAK